MVCLLICSPEYIALVRKTQTLDKEELHALSKQYDAVYFHPVRATHLSTQISHPSLLICQYLPVYAL